MSSGLSGKTTQEIEKEAKLIELDADEETLLAISQLNYQDAVEAYENQESLEAFYLFTRYLHLTAQLTGMLQLEEGENEAEAERLANELREEIDNDFKAWDDLTRKKGHQSPLLHEEIPGPSNYYQNRNQFSPTSSFSSRTNPRNKGRTTSLPETSGNIRSAQITGNYPFHNERVRSHSEPQASSSHGLLDTLAEGEHKVGLKNYNLRDISDPLCDLVQKALSLYKGDYCKRTYSSCGSLVLRDIKTVGIVVNREANRKYEDRKLACKNEGVKFEEVYAYHGTPSSNVDSIVKTNLDPKRSRFGVYGKGCYFSEYPEVSHGYTDSCMFIFRVILVKGKYIEVSPDQHNGYCQMLVINDNSYFKPEFVLYF